MADEMMAAGRQRAGGMPCYLVALLLHGVTALNFPDRELVVELAALRRGSRRVWFVSRDDMLRVAKAKQWTSKS